MLEDQDDAYDQSIPSLLRRGGYELYLCQLRGEAGEPGGQTAWKDPGSEETLRWSDTQQ